MNSWSAGTSPRSIALAGAYREESEPFQLNDHLADAGRSAFEEADYEYVRNGTANVLMFVADKATLVSEIASPLTALVKSSVAFTRPREPVRSSVEEL